MGHGWSRGLSDGSVRLWEVATQKEVARVDGHSGQVNSVSYSPDGTLLASVGGFSGDTGREDLTIRLWDAATLGEVGRLRGHENRVFSLSFSPGGDTLVSGSRDRTVRLWDVATRTPITTLEHAHPVGTVSFSRDGATLLFGAADGVWLRDMETGNTALLSEHSSNLWGNSLALSPDGGLLAAAHSPHFPVKLWDLRTQGLAGTLEVLRDVYMVDFSPDGTYLAAGSFADPAVELWDVATRSLIGILEGGLVERVVWECLFLRTVLFWLKGRGRV